MEQDERLGKIEKIDIVINDGKIGLQTQLSLDGGKAGVTDFTIWTWSSDITPKEGVSQWEEEDRIQNHSLIMKRINELLLHSKKDSLSKLHGVPIIATFRDRTTLQSFRILTEVL